MIESQVPSWRASELWAKLEKRACHPTYGKGKFCAATRVLIIGGGPCGLRSAIEAQLLGAKTVLVEKRTNYTRNNVLHLWPFAISDLRNLGAKLFYGKFCAGSIDHISIRQLQCILLKIALLLGVEIHFGVAFEKLLEPQCENDIGWKASVSPKDHPVSHFHFDVLIGADGRRSTVPGFKRKAHRAKLALAITVNFVHNHTQAEAKVQEISGVNYIFKQQFFQELDQAMGIALENIVYYKNETHYFVMTPTKQSLLEKGVLFQDFSDPEQLLSPENIDLEALQLFTMQAVVFATNNQLPNLQFATNSRGGPDVALFDFTTMYASETSCRAIERKGGNKLLVALVGDSLLEPFWPLGLGISRGFLASYDAAWMIRSWGKGRASVCEVLAERESIYRMLPQTTHENLNKDYDKYSIDPSSRYTKINFNSVGARQVRNLFDSDEDVKDIFLSIRDSRKCRKVSETVISFWFKEQLSKLGITIHSLLDIFTNGDALLAIIQLYRSDLVDYYTLHQANQKDNNLIWKNNECAFDILRDEYNIPTIIDGESSMNVTEAHLPQLVQYLSQVYNAFSGEIPKPTEFKQEFVKEASPPQPNNSTFHHTLSIKQFLDAKDQLEKKKVLDEAKFKQRSQLYESMMQAEKQNNYNQDADEERSTCRPASIPTLKLNPAVAAADLFSACRNGSNREKSSNPKIPSDTMSMIKLARSRSDVGYSKNGGFGNSSQIQPSSSSTFQQRPKNKRSELEEVQLRIRKSKTTPFGEIVSTTFLLGKHINQNSGCLSNEESDENPLSCERRRLLRRTRSRSAYQNLNDQAQATTYYNDGDEEDEDQENVDEGRRSTNPFFNNHEQDPGFSERCKFLEKSLYNSGREIKVHIGAAWSQKGNSDSTKKKNNPCPPPGTAIPLKKSQSSGLTTGFDPLSSFKRGSSFNVRNKMAVVEESLSSSREEEEEDERVGVDKGEKESNPKALFLERRLTEMRATHPEWRSDEKIPSAQHKNDHNSHHHHFHSSQQRRQQSGTAAAAAAVRNPDLERGPGNMREKSQREGKKSSGTSSAVDSDLDCFLNAIDFERIDGQDLQELLSSY
ncbi:F-actin-monooxygenase MICAL2 isoform X2 [Folsomia candida]|uniref:F-actin-monooxygenase MICAL2 isoform X2 n=1 Tax=Folsomia candida TaxID=158441 RepID=UPI001604F3CC|nr:F-actin-monooxygenase MICAL2 isoform X2 [Folsomia candida]